MMNNRARIVRSWAGSGTTETFYEDEYGRIWRQDIFSYSQETTAAPVRGKVRDGYIELCS